MTERRRFLSGRRPGLVLLFAVQGLCALFFVGDILLALLGLRAAPVSWQVRELVELGAAFGLVAGTVFGGLVLRRSARRTEVAEAGLRAASGAFAELLEDRFAQWGLTPAERDVALFAIKGHSTQDIARLRNTSEGTVKAQTNAIYRKAGVSGRPQLLSLFIEDLLAGPLLPATPQPPPARLPAPAPALAAPQSLSPAAAPAPSPPAGSAP